MQPKIWHWQRKSRKASARWCLPQQNFSGPVEPIHQIGTREINPFGVALQPKLEHNSQNEIVLLIMPPKTYAPTLVGARIWIWRGCSGCESNRSESANLLDQALPNECISKGKFNLIRLPQKVVLQLWLEYNSEELARVAQAKGADPLDDTLPKECLVHTSRTPLNKSCI